VIAEELRTNLIELEGERLVVIPFKRALRPNAGSIPGMAQSRCPLEFGDCDEEMTNHHNTPCEDVLRNALMNEIGGLLA
jgi:hypothetical protein